MLQGARHAQVTCFKQKMGEMVEQDTMITNMPRIRITASKANASAKNDKTLEKAGI